MRTDSANRRPGARLWPDARQERLLQAGLAIGPMAMEAWREVSPDLDPDALDPGSARLVPLVWWNLRRHGVGGPLMAAMERCYTKTRAANEGLLEQLGSCLAAFNAARIPTMVLKGPALLQSVYADGGLRPMSDLDVLVPLDRVADASGTLGRLGWRPTAALTPAMQRLTHSVPFAHAARATVDLHWHVFEECCRPDDDDDLWMASTLTTFGGSATRVLAPEDQLIQACVHGEKWVRIPGVRWIADAVLLIRSGRIDWPRLVAHATRRRFVLRMRAQLEYLRAVFEAPVPREALALLAAAPASRLERFEERWGLRDRRRPWMLVYWCNHLRSATRGLPTTVLTFPRYLQATWRLGSVVQVPGAAATRLCRYVSGRWERA